MSVNEAARCLPTQVANRAAFSVDADLFTWADVMRAAEASSSWNDFLASVREGVMAHVHARAEGRERSAAEADAAMAAFRYHRNLIAGDDLLSWLAHWAVTAAEWEASLHRASWRAHFASGQDTTWRSNPIEEAAIVAAAWPDAVCTGFVEQSARQLAADLALAAETGQSAGARSSADFGLVRAAADAARQRASAVHALEREIASHRMEWTSVRGWLLTLSDQEVAKEAAMCVRADGKALADVARDCGTEAEAVNALFADIDEALSAQTLAATEGDLIGPVHLDGAWRLVAIETKTPPTLEDPLVRKRARESAIAGAEERAMSRQVTWRESF